MTTQRPVGLKDEGAGGVDALVIERIVGSGDGHVARLSEARGPVRRGGADEGCKSGILAAKFGSAGTLLS